jgi:hypothetical protein
MYRFLEQKPVVVVGKIVNSKARTWVATLSDERFPEEREAVGLLQIALLNSLNQETRGAIKNVEKLLIVTCTSTTQMFMTLFKPDQKHAVKRLLENLLKHFGEHVLSRALESVHMMNDRDESNIQAWWMAGEFEESQKHEDMPKRKEDLHKMQNTVVKYSGTQGCERVQSQLSTMSNQIVDLEKELASLSLERDEHSLGQRINQCSDPKEKEWLEAEFAAESDIPEQMDEVRITLHKIKLDQEYMHERLKRCMAVVVNFKPDVVLYKVDFMSEAEREELIQDRLDLTLKYDAKTYVGIYDDPNKKAEAAELKSRIENEVVKTHYNLMKQGFLPDFEKDSRKKGQFLERTMNVTKHLLDGQVSDKKAYKDKADSLQKQTGMKCSIEDCKKYCHNPHWYRVKETGICYPISSLSSETAPKESILVFCSFRCEEKWDEKLMCPKCKTFDWKYDEKGIAPYPCPFKLLDNFAQYDYCRQNLANFPVCPITRTEPKMIRLPLCTSCDNAMMPRTPEAPHLTLCFSYDDMPMPRGKD